MGAKFLTQEWMNAFLAALNTSDAVKGAAKGVDLCIQQVVTGSSGDETGYWTKFEDGKVSGALGETADADVTIAQDYDTAVAMTKGEINAQAAFMQGKLKITGNMGKLLQHQSAMQALAPVLASVDTDF